MKWNKMKILTNPFKIAMSNIQPVEKMLNNSYSLVYNKLIRLELNKPWYYEDIVEDGYYTHGGSRYRHSLRIIKEEYVRNDIKGECECDICQCSSMNQCYCNDECDNNKLIGYTFSNVLQYHYPSENENEDEWEYYDQWEGEEFRIDISGGYIRILKPVYDDDWDIENTIIPYIKEFIELLIYEANKQ